jgi:hypothetical protein
MSPDFAYYIDIDRAVNKFVIREPITNKTIYTISRDLMNPMEEDPRDIMNRFMWITKDKVKILNKEGIEKIIDMGNDCEEIEFNVIPLFNNEEIKE